MKVYILQTQSDQSQCDFIQNYSIETIEPKNERDQIEEALKKCRDNVCLLLRDNSVSICENVEYKIEEIMKRTNLDFDICYLCKWMDRCDLYRDRVPLEGSSSIVSTSNPHGIQALLVTKRGREILLGERPMNNGEKFNLKLPGSLSDQLAKCIYEKNIEALCIVPNIIEFDVMKATRNEDYNKLRECQDPPLDQIRSNNYSQFWAYLIVFLIILLIAVCIFFTVYKR